MNTVISFTPAQLFAGILAVCAGISCIAAAIAWIAKGVKKVQAPNEKQDQRLADLEARVARHDEFFTNDKRRMEAIEEGERVTQRAILALLSHGIDGNDVDAMREAKNELQEYLIKR